MRAGASRHASCADASVANSCGIHIHEGTSCTADAGLHYYAGLVTVDPWATITYTATGSTTSGTLAVSTGATQTQVTGRAMIIHDRAGARVACALL